MTDVCYCDEDQGAGYTFSDEHGDCDYCIAQRVDSSTEALAEACAKDELSKCLALGEDDIAEMLQTTIGMWVGRLRHYKRHTKVLGMVKLSDGSWEKEQPYD